MDSKSGIDIRQEIRQCRIATGMKSGLPWATFVFPPQFSGFAGHFPGKPVVPGVCMIQSVAVLLEDWHRRAVQVIEVQKTRFAAPAGPGDVLEIECRSRNDSQADLTACCVLRRQGDHKATECTLRYRITTGSLS